MKSYFAHFLIVALLTTTAIARATGTEQTRYLDGYQITYTYENGMSFELKYTPEGVLYRFLTGDSPEKWWGPFPYRAFKTSPNEFFLGWYEKGFGDQITQLVNLKEKTLYGSGIIIKGKRVVEHFEKATIDKVNTPRK